MHTFKFKLDKMFCVTSRYLSGNRHYALYYSQLQLKQ